ncbi:MAG: hypothetical protein A2583_10330 [Bdellovibrionales bacterium RIFOXYD1_FULL_53_11]|nr:MAG: hypothetical protein A2583_10330 [Bdellovibrionales bacterium RIFOXYD1_FULL_53_11]
MRVPPSEAHPAGYTTTRHAHCASNPTGRDQLYPDEIQDIANKNFSKIKDKPCPLPLKFPNGSKFDHFIAGWVRYWNDVFKPDDPLDPNLVKALIASESSFYPDKLADKKRQSSARGLMQITNDTRKIIGDEKGEIKDHYLTVTRQELNDPGVNICAGIRWLFHKFEYKGCLKATDKKRANEIMNIFRDYLEAYRKCGK